MSAKLVGDCKSIIMDLGKTIFSAKIEIFFQCFSIIVSFLYLFLSLIYLV